MNATTVTVPDDRRRIGRSLLLAVVAPIAFLVIAGGVAVAIGDSSFLVVLVLAWIPVVFAAMVGTHEILWGRGVESLGQRITKGLGSFALCSLWLIGLGKAAVLATPWVVSLLPKR